MSDDAPKLLQHIDDSWRPFFDGESSKPYFQQLIDAVDAEYSACECFPAYDDILRAFELTGLDDVKVVIVGQDPYHGDGQAHGLAFSVPNGTPLPPSLRNIARELESELGHACIEPERGDLSGWARQGVLLLNSTFTVRAHQAASHARMGWSELTDSVIAHLSAQRSGLVFMLWGNHAISKAELVDESRHLILTSAHPSPLSARRGFFGNRHFLKCNEHLRAHGIPAVEWDLRA